MPKIQEISIYTGGDFGTALAFSLAPNNLSIALHVNSLAQADDINRTHENRRRFPGLRLPDNVRATSDLKDLNNANLVVLAVPTPSVRGAYRDILPYINPEAYIVSAVKGIEQDTHLLPSQILSQENPNLNPARVAVLSGPNIAGEMMQSARTQTVIASTDWETARRLQEIFTTDILNVDITNNRIATEAAGALKNPITVGMGLVTGLGVPRNTQAVFFTQGLAEIKAIADALADDHQLIPKPVPDAAMISDLFVSCLPPGSRNHKAGVWLATGEKTVDQLRSGAETYEGLDTVASALALAQKYGVEVPFIRAVNRIVNEQLSPRDVIEELMQRPFTANIRQLAGLG